LLLVLVARVQHRAPKTAARLEVHRVSLEVVSASQRMAVAQDLAILSTATVERQVRAAELAVLLTTLQVAAAPPVGRVAQLLTGAAVEAAAQLLRVLPLCLRVVTAVLDAHQQLRGQASRLLAVVVAAAATPVSPAAPLRLAELAAPAAVATADLQHGMARTAVLAQASVDQRTLVVAAAAAHTAARTS
jgi:hypothetical protein